MGLIILGHIVGDFYLQTDKIASNKKTSMKYMILHCLIYSMLMAVIILLLSNDVKLILQMTGLILITHFIIDIMKKYLDKRYEKYEYMIFLLDQVVHIVVLLIVYYFLSSELHNKLYDIDIMQNLDVSRSLLKIIAVLVCWKPAAIFVSLVFKIIPETIELADEVPKIIIPETKNINEKKDSIKAKQIDKETVKIGFWIGILEREIILVLGLMGQYGAIGFVLTAKSLARFKQLENKSFAEKYLVGTLLSALIAIVCIVVCLI